MADTIESVDVAGVHGQVALNPDGTAIGTLVGGATASNQTNGSQKTQIVDAGGEVVTVTGGRLDVNATASLAGQAIPVSGATEAVAVQIVDGSGNQIASFGGGTQYTEGDTDATLTGTVAMVEGAANAVAPMTQPLTDTQLRATAVPVSGTVTANLSATDNAVLDAIEVDTTTIAGAVSGTEMQVDIVAALPAGTNAIGKLAANSGVDIGDTDVTSVIPGTGATNLGKAVDTATGATDTGVLALATRDDALSALTPIEGDNVQLRTDANGALWTHDDALDAALSGSELQVDIVGSLPAGTNAIGKLASNTGVDIGDVDVLSITNGSLNGPGAPTIDSYTKAAISAVTGANQQLVAAPGANKQIWVYGIGFTCSVAGTVAIQDEDDTAITGVMSFAQYSGPLNPPSGNFAMPLWKVATNKALEADVTTATINGWIAYAIVSV